MVWTRGGFTIVHKRLSSCGEELKPDRLAHLSGAHHAAGGNDDVCCVVVVPLLADAECHIRQRPA
jgi:hypothetical protein